MHMGIIASNRSPEEHHGDERTAREPSTRTASHEEGPMTRLKIRRWRWWTIALRGIAAILFGILALIAPGAAFMSLVVLFGVYALIDGALALALASKQVQPRGALIARGIASIAAGVLAFVWPGITAFALLIVIAVWAIVSGILELVMAIQLRKQLEGEWLLALEGVLSIGFGVLLLLSPLVGAIVLGLWIGAYALLLGGMQIGTALRLRSYVQHHPELAA
jgi:uncharacterized membrane protein HdeD (DUF308 family)